MSFTNNLNKLLLIGAVLVVEIMNGNCVSLSPETELNLRNIQYRMQDSPSASQISKFSIMETVLPTVKNEFNKILEESIQGNEGLLDYLLEEIYYGNLGEVQLFQDSVSLDKRIQYIKYISRTVFLDWVHGKAKIEQAIVALNAIILYCKEYAKELNLSSRSKLLNSLYVQVQHEIGSSSGDEIY